MGRKDHLGTPEEDYKRRTRELKKVTSVVTQGNPPVFTRGLNQAGIVGKTQGEVRDTDFPILFDIDDKTKNLLVSPATTNIDYIIDLSKQSAHYHRLKIADFDDADVPNAITNINVFFTNLAKNKEIQFTIEWIKDPMMVATPTITISPPLEGVPAQPTPFPDDFDVWYFLVSGRTLPDNTTRYELINFGTGSGTGNTFPILYPEENIGSIAGPTQNINISGTDGQDKKMTLTGNVNLTFNGFPAATVLEEFWLVVTQDAIGGHNLTATGSTLKNQGLLNSLVDKTALSQSIINFVTADGGATIHAELVDLVAGGGGGFTGLLSSLTIDVSKDWAGFAINNLAGIDLFAGAVANSVNNAAFISFISNAAATRGQFGRSDFFGSAQGLAVNIVANDNFTILVDSVEKVKFDDTADLITSQYNLDMFGNFITNVNYLESSAPMTPSQGVVRLAALNTIAWRNPGNSDDILIGVGNDSLAQQSFQVTIASGIQLTVSNLTVDVKGNNIINTGNITKTAGAHDIGESSEGFTDIFAKYFRPVGAAPTTKDGYTRVGDNRHLISFDSGTAESGFGIYEDGIQKFLFNILPTNINTLFIGSDPFVSGETYRIQMGENSGSAAKIEFTEGPNDLIIDRQGTLTAFGVSLRTGGFTRFKATLAANFSFVDLDVDGNDILNAHFIKADASGIATIGETVTFNGGFDYYVRDKIFWAGDPATFIELGTGGISLISDDSLILVANDSMIFSSQDQVNWFIAASSGMTITIGGGFPTFVFQDNFFIIQNAANMLISDGFFEIGEIPNPAQPSVGFGRMFQKDENGSSEPFWIDNLGTITSMIGGGGGGHIIQNNLTDFPQEPNLQFVGNVSVTDNFLEERTIVEILGGVFGGSMISIVKSVDESIVSSIILQPDDELTFTPSPNTIYYIEFGLKYQSNFTQIKAGLQCGSDATYQIVKDNVDVAEQIWSSASSSNVETINLSSVTGGLEKSGLFYVVVQVNSDTTPISLSWAQLSNNASPSVVQKGSLMKIYSEGFQGGGGQGGNVNEVLISTTPHNGNDTWKDTQHLFFGNDNGFSNLGIPLQNSEPGGFTFSYVIKLSDFPIGTLDGFTWERYGVNCSFQCQRNSGSPTNKFVKFYVNGVEKGSDDHFQNPTLAFLRGSGSASDGNIQVGDTIQIKVWFEGTASFDLQEFAAWVYPVAGFVNASSISADFTGLGQNSNLGADDPTDVNITIAGNSTAFVFSLNQVEGMDWPSFQEPPTIIKGIKLEPIGAAVTFIAATSQSSIFTPGIQGLVKYQWIN